MSRSSPWPRRAILSLVLLLVVVLVGGLAGTERQDWRWRASPHPVATSNDGSDPSQGVPATAEVQLQALTEASLHIWVRAINQARYTNSWPPVAFEAIWPDSGDPSWRLERFDGLSTPAGLLELSDPRFDYQDPPRDLLPAAYEEGFAGGASNVSTPEAALLSLYATWVEADATFADEWDSFVDAHLPEGETWASVGQEGRDRIRGLRDYPSQDLEALRELAREVLAKWPEHPIADHARFSLLRAAVPRAGEPDHAEVLDMLAGTESASIREQGAIYLTRSLEQVSPDIVAALEDIRPSSTLNDLRLSTWALNRAILLEEWDRALTWSERLRTTLQRECTIADPDRRLHCETRGYELRDASARLVALGLTAPRTWQEALTAAAWRCHLEVAVHSGTSRTIATWNSERWSFAQWDVPTDTTRCLDQIVRTELVPAEPTRVRLTLEGPPR